MKTSKVSSVLHILGSYQTNGHSAHCYQSRTQAGTGARSYIREEKNVLEILTQKQAVNIMTAAEVHAYDKCGL